MHLSLDWKVLFVSIGITGRLLAQSAIDTVGIEDFRNQWVVYADIGYNTAPFNISYPFSGDLDNIEYRNNFRTILGIGAAYKWFAVRVGIPILKHYRPSDMYSKTDQFNIALDYSYKSFYADGQLNICRGYAALNAKQWNQNSSAENELFPSALSYNLSIGAWYFRNKNFKINALLGKRAHCLKEGKTWYLRSNVSFFGLNNAGNPIFPISLINSQEIQTSASKLEAYDLGLTPGYAYGTRLKNWQVSGWAGVGAVVQVKEYSTGQAESLSLGLAPRFDIRLMGGYSVPQWFIFLITDFDNKSMRFDDLDFRQYFYGIKLVMGKRFG